MYLHKKKQNKKHKQTNKQTKMSNTYSLLRLNIVVSHIFFVIFSVCHAEMNAIVNKVSADITGCTIYVTLFPCNNCAKIIIQSRIKDVVYYDDKNLHKDEAKASVYMFRKAGINVR
jgi:deoxycytidylate deaminase